MSIVRSCFIAVVAALCGGCFRGRVPSEYAHASQQVTAPAPTFPTTPAPTLAQDEATLATEARPDVITRIAVARSPAVLEARAHAPLNRPGALGETNMHMFGLRQTFPAAGTLDAQARMAFEQAKIALERGLVFPEVKIAKPLPLNQPVAVVVASGEARTLTFQCGMGMFKSKVVVQ